MALSLNYLLEDLGILRRRECMESLLAEGGRVAPHKPWTAVLGFTTLAVFDRNETLTQTNENLLCDRKGSIGLLDPAGLLCNGQKDGLFQNIQISYSEYSF